MTHRGRLRMTPIQQKDQQQAPPSYPKTVQRKPIFQPQPKDIYKLKHKPLIQRSQCQLLKISQADLPRPYTSALDTVSFSTNKPYKPEDMIQPNKKSTINPGHNFVRSTVEGICVDPLTTKLSQIPIGAIFQPFFNEEVAKYTVSKPERCQRCLAYVNNMFRFEANCAICHLCGHRFQRNPDMYPSEPIYDIIITSAPQYIRKRIDRIHYLFCIQSGFSWNQTIFQSIKAALPSMGTSIYIGFLIFDYNIWTVRTVKGGYKQKLEITSSQPAFLPMQDNQMFLNCLQETQTLYENIDWLQEQCAKFNTPKRVGPIGTLLKIGAKAFDKCTGKIIMFYGSAPFQGFGKTQPRTKEMFRKPFYCQHKEFQQFGQALLAKRVMVDSYVFGHEHCRFFQLPTTFFVSSLTGGSISHFPIYDQSYNSQKLYYELYYNLTKTTVFDVEYTCRVSNGLLVHSFLTGAGIIDDKGSELSGMDCDKTVSVILEQDEKCIRPALQFACLYTNSNKERVIRVINYEFQICENIGQIFMGMDYLGLSLIVGRRLAPSLFKNEIQKVSDELKIKIQNILVTYKNNVVKTSYLDILQVQSSMKLLPLYIYCIKKLPLFSTQSINPDCRLSQYIIFMTGGFHYLSSHLYPKIYKIDLSQQSTLEQQHKTGLIMLPSTCPSNGFLLSKTAIYLIDDYQYLSLYISQYVNPQILELIFGQLDISKIRVGEMELIELQNDMNKRLRNIVESIRNRRVVGHYISVVVIDGNRLNYLLKEQSMTTIISYANFLYQIQNTLNKK